jgi:transcriptional regulator with XRE-family HTH domain
MRMTIELALGREIKKIRKVLHQSQEALAFETGIHRTYQILS